MFLVLTERMSCFSCLNRRTADTKIDIDDDGPQSWSQHSLDSSGLFLLFEFSIFWLIFGFCFFCHVSFGELCEGFV